MTQICFQKLEPNQPNWIPANDLLLREEPDDEDEDEDEDKEEEDQDEDGNDDGYSE